jgi:hypothetical protein
MEVRTALGMHADQLCIERRGLGRQIGQRGGNRVPLVAFARRFPSVCHVAVAGDRQRGTVFLTRQA